MTSPDLVALDTLARYLLDSDPEHSEEELSSLADVDPGFARTLWQAMGFVHSDSTRFTEADLRALRQISSLLAHRSPEVIVQDTRVISSLLARTAEALAPILADELSSLEDSGLPPEDAATALVETLRAYSLTDLVSYVFRRHLLSATTRALTSHSSSLVEGVVLFADIVGFTALSRSLSEADLASLVTSFHASAYDLSTLHAGRVVKTVGDEVMVYLDSPDAALDLAATLRTAATELDLTLRIGVAQGDLLPLSGDFFGPTVNLAARLVSHARPGSILVSDSLHAAAGLRSFSHLHPTLKGIGTVSAWRYRPERDTPSV